MRDSPATIIQNLLVGALVFGDPLGSGLNWPLYIGFLPDIDSVPDSAAAVYDTAGIKDGRVMQGENIMHYGIQIRTRAQTREDSWSQAAAARDYLEQVKNSVVTIGARVYTLQNVSQQGPVLFLGIEDGVKRRMHHTVNFILTIIPGVFGGAAPIPPLEDVVVYEKTFTWQTGSPLFFGPLAAGDVVIDSDVVIETAFNDPAATVDLGFQSSPGGILSATDIDPAAQGTYNNSADYAAVGADRLELRINPGTSNQGSGRVIVTVVPAQS